MLKDVNFSIKGSNFRDIPAKGISQPKPHCVVMSFERMEMGRKISMYHLQKVRVGNRTVTSLPV
jgi:hypothetical protein